MSHNDLATAVANYRRRTTRDERDRAPIVGLIGYARSGKDTVAARLVDKHGWTRFAFADALRKVLLDVDPLVADEGCGCYPDEPLRLSDLVTRVGWDAAKADPEVRRLLQALGVAVRTHIGEETWVNIVLDQLYARGPVVITDVRFQNEANAIRDRGGRLVRIVRPGYGPVNGHVSERDLERQPVHLLIRNSGTVDELHATVDAAVARWWPSPEPANPHV